MSMRTPARSRRWRGPRRGPGRRRPMPPNRRRRASPPGRRLPGADRRATCRRSTSRAKARSSTSTPADDRRLVERPLDLGAAAVAARVDDPPVAVATLAAQRRAVAVVPRRIEGGAQAHQVADRRRRLGNELADDGLVAQPGAGGERVADVVLQRVGGVEHGGEAALGPRRGAGRQLPLVTIRALRTGRTARAAARPAAPEPTTTTSTSRSQDGAGAAS